MEHKNNSNQDNLPTITTDLTFSSYINQVKKYPTLSQEEEYMLAKRVREYHDVDAAQKLVTSHLKLVAKMAYKMRGYGVALMDLVSEGNIGLMHAVKKFDPDMGHRLSTYAMWWIKASMQEFIIKSWSLVKIGTTSAQKKLFFNLNKAKKKLLEYSGGQNSLDVDSIEALSKDLNVSTKEIIEMDSRLQGGDISLDLPVNSEDTTTSSVDLLPSEESNQETTYIESEIASKQKQLFQEGFDTLNDREKDIIQSRYLDDSNETLSNLSEKYSVSIERVRQIEKRAIEKIRKYCQDNI